jgi:DhnA family fructose-bisphosphate aldolase class Ia
MIGTQLRLHRLLPPNKNIIILPVDHGEFQGPRNGLINTRATVAALAGYDAVLLSPGQLERCWDVIAARPGLVAIVRLNWNSDYCFQWDYRKGIHGLVRTPEEALALGADAVLGSLAVGTGDPAADAASVEQYSRLAAAAKVAGVPIGGEVYPGMAGLLEPDAFHDLVLRSCRILSELGADFIKTFYTGPRFAEVIEATPVPVIVLGASKTDERDALKMAAAGLVAGARGVVFGRNVFESSEPQRFLDALGDVVHKGATPEAAANQHRW